MRPLLSGESISSNPVSLTNGAGTTQIVLRAVGGDNCCRQYVLTALGADSGTGFIKVWFAVTMDVERWKNCDFVSCPNLGSYFCTTACIPNGLSQRTAFVALTATRLCSRGVLVRNPSNGITQSTAVQDVGPRTNDPCWNTGNVPIFDPNNRTATLGGCLSERLADSLGVANGCSGTTPFGRWCTGGSNNHGLRPSNGKSLSE